MALQAIFERKPSDFCLQDFEVSKTIRLPAEVFEDVLKNPIQDYDFIRENIDLMRSDSNGVYHCLLLTGEGRNDGLLVESESYGYCRYASYVPDASALTSPALQQFNQKLTEAVDYIVETGTQNTTKGNWIVSFDELEKQTEINLEFNDGICNVLVDMLSEREAVDDVELTDSGMTCATISTSAPITVPTRRKLCRNLHRQSRSLPYGICFTPVGRTSTSCIKMWNWRCRTPSWSWMVTP